MLVLGNSRDSVSIVIISVIIMREKNLAKNYYCDSGHVVTECALDIVLPQYTHKHVKKHEKIARNISH